MTMISNMPRYEQMKDSGVEWLGEIPEHWTVLQGKRAHKNKKELNSLKQCSNILSLTLRGVVNNDPDNPEGLIPKDYGSYQIFEKNDLVFKLIDLENLKTSRVGLVHEKGIMSSAYIRLIVGLEFFPKYAFYYYYNLYLNAVYNNLGAGVRSTLSSTDLLDIFVIAPPFPEQTAISTFIDQKTAKIDQAIALKQKQIELFKERKQLVIQQAVTKGLNPNAPMRDSGVEWIGEIPEHWIVSKIGHFAKVSNGSTPSRDVPRYWENGKIPWISSGKVNDYVIFSASEYVSESALRECSLKIFPKGTVLIGIVGQGKTRGTSALLEIEAAINQNVAGIIPSSKISSKFLHQYLIQAYEKIRNYGKGSNQEALNCSLVSSIKIAFPPINEQISIINYIETQSAKIDKAIDIQQQQINKLKEYKATLINSAVTGKIKVV